MSDDRKRMVVLTVIMAAACGIVVAVAMFVLYRVHIAEARADLMVTAQSQARLIEAVARYNARHADRMGEGDSSFDAGSATLGQIIDAHEHYHGLGETGEFTVAKREGDSIVFQLRHRHDEVETPEPIAFDSDLAEPVRRALLGLSGTLIGLDYRGETVLAAHEPVAELNLGIVAKIDLAEVRAPFLKAGTVAGTITVLVVLVGVMVFLRISNPMIARLESHARDLREEAEERKQAEDVLDAINSVFREALICETVEQVANVCLKGAEELTGSKFGFIAEVNARGRFDTFAISDTGWSACRVPGGRELLMANDLEIRGVRGCVVRDGKALLLNEPTKHPEWIEPPEGHPRITCFLGVPLRQGDRVVGMIGLANKDSPYNATDQQIVEELSTTYLQALLYKRSEAALRESEETFRSMVDGMKDYAMFMLDSGGYVTTWNAGAQSIKGYRVEEIIGEHFSRFYLPEDVQNGKPERELAVAAAQGRSEDEGLRVRKNGSQFFANVVITALHDEAGELRGFVKVTRDVTDEKRAGHRLERELTSVTAVLNDMLQGELDDAQTEERVLEACLAATDSIYGMIGKINEQGNYDTTTYSSRTLHDCAFPEALTWEISTGMPIRGIWGWAMQHGEPLICNDLQSHPDRVGYPEGHVAIDCFLGVLLRDEGKTVGTVAVANKPGGYSEADKDTLIRLASVISVSRQHRGALMERKRTMAELEQLNAAMVNLADDLRTTNSDLESTAAQLAEANKELEGFSYSVSHDLRAPLRHLTGFADLLRKHADASLDEKSRRYIGIIAESAQQMGNLIDDLLDFSRTGRAEMKKSRFPLDELVNEVVASVCSDAGEREIEWEIADLPEVLADRALLRLVLVNLLANAVKYTRPRSPARIEIGCAPSDEAETVISVRDNGVGFDMRYVDKLFGVFQRLHRADEFEGTGIGLANVQRIIRRHGGEVWAEGEVDRGATFYFSLPGGGEAQT